MRSVRPTGCLWPAVWRAGYPGTNRPSSEPLHHNTGVYIAHWNLAAFLPPPPKIYIFNQNRCVTRRINPFLIQFSLYSFAHFFPCTLIFYFFSRTAINKFQWISVDINNTKRCVIKEYFSNKAVDRNALHCIAKWLLFLLKWNKWISLKKSYVKKN